MNGFPPNGGFITIVCDTVGRPVVSNEAYQYKIRISEPLRHLEFVKDELKISNSGVVTVIRRLGTTDGINGKVYELDEEITEILEDIEIISPKKIEKSKVAILHTFEDETYIYVKEFYNLDYEIKYITQSDYSDQFITKVDFKSSLTITSQEILSKVSATYVSETELNSLEKSLESSISQTAESITSTVSATYASKADLTSTEKLLKSEIKQTATDITSTVSDTYSTKEDLTETEKALKSEIKQTAKDITLSVSDTYSTKTDLATTENVLQSVIKQNSTSILNRVSADYATKKSVSASLELKVDTEKLISEINASADRISLKAGRLVITSGNFKLDEDGNVTCTNGNFSGTITSNNATITGGKVNVSGSGSSTDLMRVSNSKNSNQFTYIQPCGIGIVGHGRVDIQAQSDNSSISSVFVQASSGAYTEIVAGRGAVTGSKEEFKKNIECFSSGLELIKNSKIYAFNLKDEMDSDKKHIGFVIGDNYRTPREVINQRGDGIDTYSMSAIMWKAIQELNQKIEVLKECEK